ncbi:hypothetical protein NGRA_3141 [Nosema granulosis]|uniref:Uncharacterized protein n=1 Tax=Nosema granulosis TaxID=83296 RepID=A0A9P6GVV0_9MICR|nr:hypothetical protein NGRA_3141 [Nosema granulosis]
MMFIFINLTLGMIVEMEIFKDSLPVNHNSLIEQSNLWTLELKSFDIFEMKPSVKPYDFFVAKASSKTIILHIIVDDIINYDDPNVFFSITLFPQSKPVSAYRSKIYQLKILDRGSCSLYIVPSNLIIFLVQINCIYKRLIFVRQEGFPISNFDFFKDKLKTSSLCDNIVDYKLTLAEYRREYFRFLVSVVRFIDYFCGIEFSNDEISKLSEKIFTDTAFNMNMITSNIQKKIKEVSYSICDLIDSHDVINNKTRELIGERNACLLNLCKCCLM